MTSNHTCRKLKGKTGQRGNTPAPKIGFQLLFFYIVKLLLNLIRNG